MTHSTLWIIPALPLLGFLVNGLLGKKLGKLFVSFVGPGLIFISFFIAVSRFLDMLDHGALVDNVYTWMAVGNLHIDVSLTMDQLSGMMLLVVTGVGALIHLYSVGYMWEEDDSFYRFFSYLNLFIFFMTMLVLGSNMLILFLGWEGVGLCSYLLIGYYTKKKSAGDAAKKAFIVNRIGDFGFLAAMFLIFYYFGTLDFAAINAKAGTLLNEGVLTGTLVTAICLFLFLGATGKSAQIPLYVWLPDAMEGPTPVSALIHAATMVTSGLYMISRLSHLFILSPTAMGVIAIVGGFTALFAASIGLAQNDIKKVLAYSTVSQLGYMFLAMGVGAFAAGMFHVVTHAFFKALLFLGSGSVIHAVHHEQDMRFMGQLRKKIPVTWITFAIGTWALAGLPLGAGFFSKDEILWKAVSSPLGGWGLWALGFGAAGFTAFYMYRLVNLTFYGDNNVDPHTHVHESPWTMLLPLIILAVLSAFAGFLAIPHAIDFFHVGNVMEHYFDGFFPQVGGHGGGHHGPSITVEYVLMVASVALAFFGMYLGRKFYFQKTKVPQEAATRFATTYKLLLNKYFIDEVYDKYVIRPIQWVSTWVLWKGIDVYVIDLIVNTAGRIAYYSGVGLKAVQSGLLQHYAVYMLFGIIAILGYFL